MPVVYLKSLVDFLNFAHSFAMSNSLIFVTEAAKLYNTAKHNIGIKK